jgi:hypothetical protein
MCRVGRVVGRGGCPHPSRGDVGSSTLQVPNLLLLRVVCTLRVMWLKLLGWEDKSVHWAIPFLL